MIITAILAVRNEARYLPVILRRLADNDIAIAIIDNESDDHSAQIYDAFRRHIVLRTTLPFHGYYDLDQILAVKAEVCTQLRSDWWIHHDGDEILESPRPDESLREGIERVAREGYDAINFEEFVFVPTRQQPNIEGIDFSQAMRHYYYFAPKPLRLQRVWRNRPDIQHANGGHRLVGTSPIRFSEEPFLLRHYIALSQSHANTKYSQRHFAPAAVARGMHRNRLNVPAVVRLPDESELHRLLYSASKAFATCFPRRFHFWQPGWLQESSTH